MNFHFATYHIAKLFPHSKPNITFWTIFSPENKITRNKFCNRRGYLFFTFWTHSYIVMLPDTKELIVEALKVAFKKFMEGDYGNAEEIYRQIIRIDNTNKEAIEIGSMAISHNGKHDAAIQWGICAITHDPNNYRLYNNLGLIYSAADNHKMAIECFKQALDLAPEQEFLYTNLAIEYKKINDYKSSFDILDKAISMHPSCEHIYFNYGAIAHEIGDIEKATSLYLKAIKIKDDFPVCHYNLSACYFLMNNYSDAWREYEWRWKHFERFAKIKTRFDKPYWSGQDLFRKKILLYTEQGIGDTIMMVRFAKHLKKMGAYVILECIPQLKELLKSCDGIDEIHNKYEGDIDYHCSLLSLPGILGMDFNKIPYEKYLHSVNLEDSGGWSNYARPRIGICWTGNPMHPNDRNRSCKLSLFKGLNHNGTLFSLQYDSRAHGYPDIGKIDWAEGAEGLNLVDLSPYMEDFNRTAKMIENLDLVITVDSVVTHIAGAIGIPTWLLLPYVPDWRWGIDGSITPWYPNMKIFRQRKIGEWEDVFKEINKCLVKSKALVY